MLSGISVGQDRKFRLQTTKKVVALLHLLPVYQVSRASGVLWPHQYGHFSQQTLVGSIFSIERVRTCDRDVAILLDTMMN